VALKNVPERWNDAMATAWQGFLAHVFNLWKVHLKLLNEPSQSSLEGNSNTAAPAIDVNGNKLGTPTKGKFVKPKHIANLKVASPTVCGLRTASPITSPPPPSTAHSEAEQQAINSNSSSAKPLQALQAVE